MRARLVIIVLAATLAATFMSTAPATSAPSRGWQLDCIRSRESERFTGAARYDQAAHVASGLYRQGYGAVSKSGKYRGGYQFGWSTWYGTTRRGRFYPGVAWRVPSAAEYVAAKTPVNLVPPEVQDDVAGQLLAERGVQPWPSSRKRCR